MGILAAKWIPLLFNKKTGSTSKVDQKFESSVWSVRLLISSVCSRDQPGSCLSGPSQDVLQEQVRQFRYSNNWEHLILTGISKGSQGKYLLNQITNGTFDMREILIWRWGIPRNPSTINNSIFPFNFLHHFIIRHFTHFIISDPGRLQVSQTAHWTSLYPEISILRLYDRNRDGFVTRKGGYGERFGESMSFFYRRIPNS